MNLKRTLVSTVAALGMAASVMAPVALAEDTTQQQTTSQASVADGGSFTFSIWGPAVSFSLATVSTNTTQTVSLDGDNHRRIDVTDEYSYNPDGWTLQMTASDLETADGAYSIDNDNLSVWRQTGGLSWSCLAGTLPPGMTPEVGGNEFQDITFNLGSTHMPLSGAVPMLTGGIGRGCGTIQNGYGFELVVPAGTYTGGGTAVYTGDIIVSTVNEVGS